ncbi:MAG: esterase [Bacilli bacterium]|nr:esterase [Bacilli bacterium]
MIRNMEVHTFGNIDSKNVFIQLVDSHDYSLINNEINCIKGDYCLITYKVNNWNNDLTPWEMEPIFGKVRFGSGADKSLKDIEENLIPIIKDYQNKNIYIVGYSLAGLFALYAGYNSSIFKGVVAASPSVWYKDWLSYINSHKMLANKVYLSLGDKEEHTKNQIMATVGKAINKQYESLKENGITSILEMNIGNHFVDSEYRIAKGINYMLMEERK